MVKDRSLTVPNTSSDLQIYQGDFVIDHMDFNATLVNDYLEKEFRAMSFPHAMSPKEYKKLRRHYTNKDVQLPATEMPFCTFDTNGQISNYILRSPLFYILNMMSYYKTFKNYNFVGTTNYLSHLSKKGTTVTVGIVKQPIKDVGALQVLRESNCRLLYGILLERLGKYECFSKYETKFMGKTIGRYSGLCLVKKDSTAVANTSRNLIAKINHFEAVSIMVVDTLKLTKMIYEG